MSIEFFWLTVFFWLLGIVVGIVSERAISKYRQIRFLDYFSATRESLETNIIFRHALAINNMMEDTYKKHFKLNK